MNTTKLYIHLFFIFILALAVRLHHLDHESLFMDEIHQVSKYPNSFVQIVQDAAIQAQPPLDSWIGHFVYQISDSDYAYRIPAVIFGTCSILILTFLISKICTPPIGIISGAILCLMPFHIYFSQEARPYAISMFFLCCVLWALDHLLKTKNLNMVKILGYVLICTAFLYSRSFSPLIVMITLLIILGIRLIKNWYDNGIHDPHTISILATIIAIICSLGLYYPSFKLIMLKNQRYLTTDPSLHLIDYLIRMVHRFDIQPLWEALVVQTEPLTYPMIILAIFSPYEVLSSKTWKTDTILVHAIILVPIASVLQLMVFQATSDMPFRPPYVEYLLPLMIILSSAGFYTLWKKLETKPLRYVVILIIILLILKTAMSAWSFKHTRKKEDWRGVSQYLTESFDSNHLLIFDALSLYGSWEPTFYGFPRYYRGNSHLISMAKLPLIANQLKNISLEPVVVLFQWRKIFLTPQSKYPIMPVSPGYVEMNAEGLCHDSFLNVKAFTGFYIIRLNNSSGQCLFDTATLIERMLLYMPNNSQVLEIHLALGSLYKISGNPLWKEHLDKAEMYASNVHREQIKTIRNYIESMPEAHHH